MRQSCKTPAETFDWVAFKRRAQAAIYPDIKGMTSDQEIAYFQRRAEQGTLGDWWKRIKARSHADV